MEGRDEGRAEAEGEELLRPVRVGEGRAGPGPCLGLPLGMRLVPAIMRVV